MGHGLEVGLWSTPIPWQVDSCSLFALPETQGPLASAWQDGEHCLLSLLPKLETRVLQVPWWGAQRKAAASFASSAFQGVHTWHMTWEKINLGNILGRTGQGKNLQCLAERCLGAACWSLRFWSNKFTFKIWKLRVCFNPGCFNASMENNFMLTVLICLELCAKS